MNLQSNQAGLNQPQDMQNVSESLRTLSKEDIFTQMRFVNNFNTEEETWLDSEEDFNGYLEEYE